MAKQRKRKQERKKESDILLTDQLGNDILQQLKNREKALETAEQEKIHAKMQAEKARKKEEIRLREKNKSFEELLEESQLSWKDFK